MRSADIARCEQCNYTYLDYPGDRARHRHRHDIWRRGPKILTTASRLWPADDPIAIVDAWTSPTALRRLAYDTAGVVREEKGWDFGSFPHPYGTRPRRTPRANLEAVLADQWHCGLDEYARAYLYRRGDRVVGYWVVWPRMCGTQFSLGTGQRSAVAPTVTRSVGPIWTHREHRRTGVASALHRAVIADATSPIAQAPVSVDAPISDDACGYFSHVADRWLIT